MSSRMTRLPRRSHSFFTAVSGCRGPGAVQGCGERSEAAAVQVQEAVGRNQDGIPGGKDERVGGPALAGHQTQWRTGWGEAFDRVVCTKDVAQSRPASA